MELTISEETRRGRLYIRSSKQQPGVVNKNRLLQLHSECLLIGGEKDLDPPLDLFSSVSINTKNILFHPSVSLFMVAIWTK
ncbi:hypothetical protein CapIbe_004098 [Capra ibex]